MPCPQIVEKIADAKVKMGQPLCAVRVSYGRLEALMPLNICDATLQSFVSVVAVRTLINPTDKVSLCGHSIIVSIPPNILFIIYINLYISNY